ncbi:adipolin isoform X2 [Camelus ferus]|uniref:Adipolin isoform X2 n=1 Tax=Camelus ferus TaxID=419612 RepID=A0A8B8U948_CAMFR|nr:adipolin isoform X2 [Camelus ferus]
MTGLQRDGAEAGTRRREASLAPQGLLGPRDPLDPPGGEVTQEAVLREFREMLKDATERRFSGLLDPLLPEGMGRWLVAEAFHCRLKGPVLVDAKTLVELQGFQAVGPAGLGLLATSPPPGWVCKLSPQPALPCFLQPAAQGAFLRGSGLSLASGRFTAPVTAIFQFSASLHVGRCRQSCLRRLQRAAGQGTAAGPGHGAGAGLHRVPVPSPHVPGGHLWPGEQWPGLHGSRAGAAAAAGWTVCLCLHGQRLRAGPHHPEWFQLLRPARGHVRTLTGPQGSCSAAHHIALW